MTWLIYIVTKDFKFVCIKMQHTSKLLNMTLLTYMLMVLVSFDKKEQIKVIISLLMCLHFN